jgi:hypothetical protein
LALDRHVCGRIVAPGVQSLWFAIDGPARFKAATAAQGKNMSDVLIDFIADYVQKHGVAPVRSTKKGRRG